MSADRASSTSTSGSSGATLPLVLAGVLLAAAVVVPLWVPIYAREDPTLWGFPFFYWYQLVWVFICALLVSVAHRLVHASERRKRAALGLGPRSDDPADRLKRMGR